MKRINVLGVGFDDLTMAEAVEAALGLIADEPGKYIVTPNPEIVMLAQEDAEFCGILREAALVLPDGVGIIKGASILGTPMKGKLPGIDFACALMARLAARGGRVYLFGAKPGVAELAGKKLTELYPGLVIAGCSDGYFEDDEPIKAKISSAKPDLLLVCLGAQKQERWMRENMGMPGVGLMAGLGGSLDVFAGTVRRAPERWQRMGLEWLYRILREPRRIGRAMKLPQFAIKVSAQRIKGKNYD